MTVALQPTGRDRSYRARPFFRRPAQAQRCRWLLWFCLRLLTSVVSALGTLRRDVYAPVETRSPPDFQRTTSTVPPARPILTRKAPRPRRQPPRTMRVLLFAALAAIACSKPKPLTALRVIPAPATHLTREQAIAHPEGYSLRIDLSG